MSVWAKKWAYEQRVGSSGAKAVLVALAEFADETGFCYPSQPTLAAMTEIKERTVRAHLAYLEEKQFIKREPRRGNNGQWTSDGHTLLAPPDALKPPNPNQRQNLPAAKSAVGEKPQHQRQDLPAAKSAAKPSIESDEPSVEPSEDSESVCAERLLVLYGKTVKPIDGLHYNTRNAWLVKIKVRLREGWPEAKLARAFQGCALDEWKDRWKFNGVPDILKDRDSIERFISYAERSGANGKPDGRTQGGAGGNPAKAGGGGAARRERNREERIRQLNEVNFTPTPTYKDG